jgi:two-component system KDP operon response regulator KdpE
VKVLIADDDPQIVRALTVTLRAQGYDLVTASDGLSALSAVTTQHPDLVMLDLGMPAMDGIEVIKGIRRWSQVPILVVSGRTGATDKVGALDAGADDYVTKPFSIDELLARIRALTRRIPDANEAPVITFANVTIDLATRRISRTGTVGPSTVRLTPTEWRILELLVRNPGSLISRESLLTQIWGPNHAKDTGYLRLYVAQLRKKLEPVPAAPRYFVTVLGMGYRFLPDDIIHNG